MSELLWILGVTLLIAVLALIGIITFSLKENVFEKILIYFVSFAAGALIGAAFFELIPESFHEFGVGHGHMTAPILILLGFIFFFGLEQFLRWHHCHEAPCEHTKMSFSYLILISNGIHNFIDGIIVGAAFLIDITLGISTSIAVAAHELPQEFGNFGILVYGGWKKMKALFVNLIASLMIVPGGLIAYFSAHLINPIYLIPFAAGNFIYIGASDLIPEVHGEENLKKSMVILSMFVLGILAILSVELFMPHTH